MKVVHVVGNMRRGGAEVFLTQLLPGLKERGVQVELIALADDNPLSDRLEGRGIRITTLQHKPTTIYHLNHWIPTAFRLYRVLSRIRPEIVHSHLFMPDILTRIAAPPGVKLVTTLHGPDPWWRNLDRLRSLLKLHLDRQLSYVRDVNLVAVSKSTASAAMRVFRRSAGNLRVIPNGIDLESVEREYVPKPTRKGPIIIQVGRMYWEKAHDVSLKAFKILLSKKPHALLLLVGDGPLRCDLQSQAAALGILSNVQFLGFRDDVTRLLWGSDLYWMPSRYEGLSIACLEAMACGLPVVTSDIPGLNEVTENGLTGSVVPVESPDALAIASLRILADSQLSSAMGQAAKKKVYECFSIDRCIEKYKRLYSDIMYSE